MKSSVKIFSGGGWGFPVTYCVPAVNNNGICGLEPRSRRFAQQCFSRAFLFLFAKIKGTRF
ncbi:MAG: hypothetical protein IKM45_05535 [Opitutales bacterium]|nr:hypothetical protein [Opitutales bacterium]